MNMISTYSGYSAARRRYRRRIEWMVLALGLAIALLGYTLARAERLAEEKAAAALQAEERAVLAIFYGDAAR